jgi:hypothetical protein
MVIDPLGSTTRRWLQLPVPGTLEAALALIGIALVAIFLAGFVERNVAHQGDLKTYQLAATAVRANLDPYDPESLSALAGRRVLPFVYPPVGLLPFLAVAGVPAKLFAATWMWAKIGLLGLLVLAWALWFTPTKPLLSLVLIAAFGWNSSAQWDLAAGNVAILEGGLVWAAFACYLASRRTWFAVLVVAAACFKLTPAAFLVLLLVPTTRAPASPGRFCIALTLLAVVVMGPTLLGPAAHFARFWSHVPDATDYGLANPSALGLATWSVQAAGITGPMATVLARGLWIAYAAGLITCSLPLLRHAFGLGDARRVIMVAVFLYVLLQPRPMAYGYVLLTPAPLFFSPRPFTGRVGQLVLGLVLAAQGLWRLTSNVSGSPLVTYGPFLMSLCVWLLVVNEHALGVVAPASQDSRWTMSGANAGTQMATYSAPPGSGVE